MNVITRITYSIILIFFSFGLFGQCWTFDTHSNNIADIFIDSQDVWVATRNGIYQMDKESGEKRKITTANSNLTANYFTKVMMTPEKELWVGYNYFGAAKSKNEGADWKNYEFETGFVRTIARAPSGKMYLGTFYRGIYIGDGEGEWTEMNDENSPLPNNNVVEIAFETDTSDNYVWYGSRYEGLVHNDGGEWTIYNPENSPLPYGIVTALDLDDDKNAWVGTQKGLAITNGTDWLVYKQEDSPLPLSFIEDIKVGDTCAWVATHQGLIHIPLATKEDLDTWTVYDKSNTDMVSAKIKTLQIDTLTDNIWIGTYSDGLIQFDGNTWTHFDLKDSEFIDNDIIDLTFTKDSTLLACTRGNGIGIFEDSVWTILNVENGLLANQVHHADIDTSGNVWFTYSFEGLAKWDGENITNYDASNSPLVYPLNYINDMYIDDNDIIWLANNAGFWAFDFHEDTWTLHEADTIAGNQKVTAIEPDGTGGFWYGGSHNGLKYFDGTKYEEFDTPDKKIASTIVTDIELDEWNNVWISTNSEGIFKYDTDGDWFQYGALGNSGLDGNLTTCLQYTPDSTLWIGTIGVGLYGYKLGVWSNCTAYTKCVPDANISAIAWDPRGEALWLGTLQLGLGQCFLDIYHKPEDTMVAVTDQSLVGSLTIYPNPVKDYLYLDLKHENPGNTVIDIFSQEGKLVKEIISGYLPSGEQHLEVDMSGLLAGSYYLQLLVNEERIVRIIQKD